MSGPSVGDMVTDEDVLRARRAYSGRETIDSSDQRCNAWMRAALESFAASRAELLSQVEKAEAVSTSELQQLEFDIGQGKYTAAWVFTRMRQYLSRGKLAPSTDRVAAQGGDELLGLCESAKVGFHTSEVCGPERKYWRVAKFQTLDELFAFDRAWTSAILKAKALRATPADGDGK